MVFYERASGSRMHANYFRPGGVARDLPGKLIDDIDAFCDPFLKVCDDLTDLFLDNRIFKQRNVDIGVVSLEECWKWGFSGVMVRGSGAAVGPAQVAALRVLRGDGLRHSRRPTRRQLRPPGDPHGRDAPVRAHHEAVHREAVGRRRAGARLRARQQDRAALARRNEALDGSADPSLQALHRRLPRSRRAKCTRRSRRPRASSASIWSPTAPTSPIAARSALPASRICRPWISCAASHMLADVSAILGSLDIVFGEVDR